jgi:hypothetical protein
MGFTKLDERILQSSIMAESPTTFKVWIALLAACRENGIAYVSAIYLASICHLPLSKIDDAIRKLESPDEHSRSLADDGRRIRRVDGGYEIINYIVYRDVSLRDAEAERKRLYRQRHKDCPDTVPMCPDSSASASMSASSVDLKKGSVEGKQINADDIRLVDLLISLILKNNLKAHIVKNLTDHRKADWITQCRLLREADDHTPEEIETVIRYCQADSFWKTNILSMPNLREKWDQLWLKARRTSGAEKYDGIQEWLNNGTDK